MVCLIMSEGDSLHLRMYVRKNGILPIRTGLTSALMAIHHIMTASGMRAGKDITCG